ncbi:RagB/SusD family nutrient uptake outer membrane protein [Mucilaginibacter achroorhodeus]|uniref:RagB/SusD family nutrient uptake outer membrane protein n=1 Tax=Mucilaginibacter achroorhodeus TaxID=2599294 RepID=A0A563TZ47_9SPHI|nr:RagB/SusD family nutrient uptake outer membrane protein [Mucilaginibacter achroorhodeus]TWR24627.1 RagB/SusD family nutrient uptake outer membrane protein [Mucilaginibacter achroorhodeus]
MRVSIKISAAVMAITVMAACKKYEPVPAEQRTIDFVFDKDDSLGTNAYAYLNSVYATIQSGHNRVGSSDYLDAASDDAVSAVNNATADVYNMATASYNATNFFPGDNIWGDSYKAIRQANIFITNIGIVPVKDQLKAGISMKFAWRCEARFIRALTYFNLLKRYGGVPIVGDKVFTLQDNVSLPRNSFEECVNYIVNECDAIKDTLFTAPLAQPAAYSQRVTNGAALALKAKVLLYAASPLYNGGNIDGSNALTGYASYDATRWQKAAAAAKAVMDLNAYSLVADFRNAFITQVPTNTEVIFQRPNGLTNTVEANNGPLGFTTNPLGQGKTSPSQNLVDAFPMANGLAITDAASGYDPANPYAGRDPRLGYTVFFNGARWLGSSVLTYEGAPGKPNVGTQQTATGYYMRKFMALYENASNYASAPEDWMIFRYADILLSYAEAQNEVLGAPDASVYAAVEKIRQRAGLNPYQLPAGLTKDQMRDVIRHERRLEMAFEENRFFDIRRWKIAETIMNQPVRGVTITNTAAGFNYAYGTVLTPKFKAPSMYFYPIPYDETLKNPNLKQNPGW